MAEVPRVLLIGERIGYWVSLREAMLRSCGCSQELKGLWQVVSEFDNPGVERRRSSLRRFSGSIPHHQRAPDCRAPVPLKSGVHLLFSSAWAFKPFPFEISLFPRPAGDWRRRYFFLELRMWQARMCFQSGLTGWTA